MQKTWTWSLHAPLTAMCTCGSGSPQTLTRPRERCVKWALWSLATSDSGRSESTSMESTRTTMTRPSTCSMRSSPSHLTSGSSKRRRARATRTDKMCRHSRMSTRSSNHSLLLEITCFSLNYKSHIHSNNIINELPLQYFLLFQPA